MRRFAVVSLVLVWVVMIASFVWSEEKGFQIHGTLEFSSFSKHVGSTTGGEAFDKNVSQQSFELSTEPLGLYVKVWNSVSPKGDWNSDFGDERDYILGIRQNLGKGWDIDVGYAFYDLYKIDKVKGDLHALYGWLGFPKLYGVRPFFYLE